MEFIKVEHPHHVLAEKCEKLYLTAFPDYERKPIDLLYLHQTNRQSDMFAVVNDTQEFIGLVVTIHTSNTVVLEYLAVDPNQRNQNYGSKILQNLSAQYPDHHIFLEIEPINEGQAGDILRQRRRQFYERNGYHFLDQQVNYFTTQLELMSNQIQHHDQFIFEDYIQPYIDVYGNNVTNDVYLI